MTARIDVRLLELSAAMEGAAVRDAEHAAVSDEINDVREAGEYTGRADELRKAAAAIRRIVNEAEPRHQVATKQSTHPTRGYVACCTCGWHGQPRFLADVAATEGDTHLAWVTHINDASTGAPR